MAILNLYKPVGISPLDLIENYKKVHSKFKDEKMTYAGRLDPMAEGVVLVLSGDDRYKKDDFLKFDKKYRARILFGIESDTYDVLGMPHVSEDALDLDVELAVDIDSLVGTQEIKVPPYSSVIVNSKSLFEWARSGRLDEILIPKRTMTVHGADFIDSLIVNSMDLLNDVTGKLKKVRGDFRQDKILEAWKNNLSNEDLKFSILTIDFNVGSGTYIRSIAHELGKQAGSGALLLALKRISVGDYKIENSVS